MAVTSLAVNALCTILGAGTASPLLGGKIENIATFYYNESMLNAQLIATRKGATRKQAVPKDILGLLSKGRIETVNLMEWLSADMSMLTATISREVEDVRVARCLSRASRQLVGKGILARLKIVGGAIASSVGQFDHPDFERLAAHRSDLVRQWACYAVNDPNSTLKIGERLKHSLRYAADANMSVREAAWMAFRPHLAMSLACGLEMLEPLTRNTDENVRRFAIEVSRPRSVWGAHIAELKARPHMASRLLENTRADSAKYVRLAVGNWLNDASKSQPDWVKGLCNRWSKAQDKRTAFVIRRARRTLDASLPSKVRVVGGKRIQTSTSENYDA